MPKSFVFLIFAIAAFLPVRASASDIDTLRANVTNYLTATGADTTDPIVAQALTDLETSARSYMLACLPRGGWPDINYAAALAVSPWPAMNHYNRMRTMALAYTTRGQGLFQSDSLCNAIELALDSIHDHVYSGVSLVNNYWYWLQGLPYTYGQTLVLLEGKVDSTLFAQAAATMTWFFTHPNADTWGAPGDAINVALGRLYYGVISGSTAALSKAYSLAKKEFGSLISGDGIYPDFSAVHHQTQLYIGAYGAQIAADGPRYQLFTRGTAYALGASELSKLNGFIAEATAWCLYDKYYDPSVIGRSITRVGENGINGLTGLVLMASQSGPYQTFLQRVSKRMLESWFSQLPAEIASLASDIYKTSETAAWPNGYKNFFSTYFSVHRRPNYYMSVKMMGPGIQSSEQINGEGLKSWHLSDGLTCIFRSGEEYYTHHVFPTLDWNRMPGTTIQKKYYAPMGLDTRGAINNNPFVGGVECGRYGASAMDFSSSFQALTAKKSWFFFDDEMVCLGSDITCPTTDTAETIVNQRPLSANGLPLIVNGSTVTSSLGWSGKVADASWAACDSMGYYFPGGCELSAKAVTQTGRWRSIGSGDTTLHSNPMLTLWINHGINAAGADYAYAVLPNKSAADMAAYAATPGVHVVANNDTLQAVENTPLNALGAVFWKPGICGIVQADSPCVAFWRTTPDSLYFSATYPPHTQPTIHFTLNDPLTLLTSSKTITVSTDSITTSVSFVSEQGKTMQATFRRIHKVFGYVRVTVIDSVSNNPVAGASCTVFKAYSVSDITDSLGRVVLKTDTGSNQVTVQKFTWRSVSVPSVAVLPGETTEVALSMVKYSVSGIRLFPDTLVLGLQDTGAFKVLGLYPDSSVDTLSETFAWTLLPDTLAGVSPAGQVTTGLYAGTAAVQCSSAALGWTASANLIVRPFIYLRPIADAFARDGSYANVNYGTDSILPVKTASSGYTRKAFFKFNLSRLSGLTIDSVIFKVRAYLSTPLSGACIAGVYPVSTDSWTENTLTWSNQPALGPALDTFSFAAGATTAWCETDVTAYVNQELAADGILSLGLYDPSAANMYISFLSRESMASSPVLEVWINRGSTQQEDETDMLRPLSMEIAPNPFNPSALIVIRGVGALKADDAPRLRIYDMDGRLVSDFSSALQVHRHEIRVAWSANGLHSGIYLVRYSVKGKVLVEKALLLK